MATVIKWIKRLKVSFNGTPDKADQTHYYAAQMDRPTADPLLDILAYSQCPTYFQPLQGNNNLFVVDIKVDQSEDAPQVYEVQVSYSNQYQANGSTSNNGNNFQWIQNPLQRPALIAWDTYQTREVQEYALDDQDKPNVPVITKAGEPILLEEEVERRVLQIQKNVPVVKPVFAKETNFINKDAVRIGGITFDADTLWLTRLKISPIQIENGVAFFTLSFALFYNEKTWIRTGLNAGYYYRISPNGGIKPILINGSFPSKPTPLQEDGTLSQKMRLFLGMDAPKPEIAKKLNPRKIGPVDPALPAEVPTGPQLDIFSPQELETIWKNAKLKFRTKKRINFQGNIPLK